MKILVTGGAGFIGSQVVAAYRQAGHQVAVLDNLSTGKRENLEEGTKLYEGTLEDVAFVSATLADFQPEVINHHAAQVSVVASTREPLTDARQNILGTIGLLEAAGRTPSVRKVIYASSGGAMYGNPRQLPCQEDDPAQPASPYGLSKYVAERYAWLLAASAPYALTVLRYANVYGPRQDPHGEAGVVAIFTQAMLEGRPVTIFGDGSQVRDYVYVGDVVQANLLALEKGDGGYYNIGTGVPTSTRQVAEVLAQATGYQQEPTMVPERPGEVQAIVLAPAKAERELGWQAAHTFQEGVGETVAWYRQLQQQV